MSDGGQSVIFANDEAYERFMGQWSRISGRKFIDWIAPSNGLRWLDVGCGTGAFTQEVFENCAPSEIVGIDPAETHLPYARHRLPSERVRFQAASALDMPFQDNAFDIAASALVLNFVPDQKKMVTEMNRVVRPSGMVALYVWDFSGGAGVSQHLGRVISETNPEAAKRAAAAQQAESTKLESLARVFDDAGVDAVRATAIEIDVQFPNFDDYWKSNTEFMSPVARYVGGLSQEDGAEFKQRVRDRLPIAADGTIHYQARVHAVQGLARD